MKRDIWFPTSPGSPLWNRLFEGINRISLNSIDIAIFGAVDERPAINLLILLVKQYIVRCKLAPITLTPSVQGLISFITYHIDIERRIAVSNNNIKSFRKKMVRILGCKTVTEFVSRYTEQEPRKGNMT